MLRSQISLGGQKHRSRLSRLQDGEAVWEQDLVFVATLPLRNRALRLRLLLTDSNKRRGRLVAHAFIPLADLLPQTREHCALCTRNRLLLWCCTMMAVCMGVAVHCLGQCTKQLSTWQKFAAGLSICAQRFALLWPWSGSA